LGGEKKRRRPWTESPTVFGKERGTNWVCPLLGENKGKKEKERKGGKGNLDFRIPVKGKSPRDFLADVSVKKEEKKRLIPRI